MSGDHEDPWRPGCCVVDADVLFRSRVSVLPEILAHNAQFVDRREYEPFLTDGFPDKKLVVLTCMDTRLVELLPRAMNLRNGDAKIIKNAGAIVSHPFGSVMRSLLVAIYELKAEEVAVVGHYGCGMTGLSCARVLEKAVARGVSPETLNLIEDAGINLEDWLRGFESPEDGMHKALASFADILFCRLTFRFTV